jgi:hypothetical protein
MSSEWMKVMLEEIARKRAEHEQDRVELERRRAGDAAPDETRDDRGPAGRGPADRDPADRDPG